MRHRVSRLSTVLLALLVAALGTAIACSVNPATGERQLALVGEQQEIAMGREADQQISRIMGLYPDDDLQRYVDAVGKRLAANSERPDLPWTFRVVDDPVVNAFALPGGYIYLTRGILAHFDSEAEMAAVLGHEIGHVTARHSVEQLSRQQLAGLGMGLGMIFVEELREYGGLAQTGLGLLFLKYGRDDERQADDLGLRYMAWQRYDPRQLPQVFDTLARVSAAQGAGRVPAWLSTHPDPGARSRRLAGEVQKAVRQLGDPLRVAREEYIGRLDGVVFGDDPRQGYFRDSSFYHPEMAFRIDFPAGWQTVNQRTQVAAQSPNRDAVVVLALDDAGSADAAARQFFSQSGLRAGNTRRDRVHGLTAVRGAFEVPRQQGGDVVGNATFVEHGGRVFRILGYTGEGRWSSYGNALQATLGSFRRVTDRRYLDVAPARLDVVRLPRAMTLREFARSYRSSADLETLALINQATADTRFSAGMRVKRVVGGDLP